MLEPEHRDARDEAQHGGYGAENDPVGQSFSGYGEGGCQAQYSDDEQHDAGDVVRIGEAFSRFGVAERVPPPMVAAPSSTVTSTP
ncbi:hypothetical protein ACWEPH_01575 [Nocardia beijingensis]